MGGSEERQHPIRDRFATTLSRARRVTVGVLTYAPHVFEFRNFQRERQQDELVRLSRKAFQSFYGENQFEGPQDLRDEFIRRWDDIFIFNEKKPSRKQIKGLIDLGHQVFPEIPETDTDWKRYRGLDHEELADIQRLMDEWRQHNKQS